MLVGYVAACKISCHIMLSAPGPAGPSAPVASRPWNPHYPQVGALFEPRKLRRRGLARGASPPCLPAALPPCPPASLPPFLPAS